VTLEPSELFPEVPNLYEFPSVHADMIFDPQRVGKYWDAISKIVRPGDLVADIGTGTGILAFLALRAGARHVHAIERSPAINWARRVATGEGLDTKITFHAADSRDVTLPPVDVIVSELIGHIAFEEGMVESLFDARRRFLAPGGHIVPRRVALKATLVHEREIYPSYIDCWQERPYGIDYSPLRDEALKACYLTTFSDRDMLCESQTFFEVDFQGNEPTLLEGQRSFEASRAGNVNGVAFWFEAELAPAVVLSSGPWSQTHWKQCFAPIPEPREVRTGDSLVIDLRMQLRRCRSDQFLLELRVR